MKYTLTTGTIIALGIALLMIRKQELKMMFENNDYLNKVLQGQLKLTDQQIFISNQPWI